MLVLKMSTGWFQEWRSSPSPSTKWKLTALFPSQTWNGVGGIKLHPKMWNICSHCLACLWDWKRERERRAFGRGCRQWPESVCLLCCWRLSSSGLEGNLLYCLEFGNWCCWWCWSSCPWRWRSTIQPLLVWKEAFFLVLSVGRDVVDGAGALILKVDGLAN